MSDPGLTQELKALLGNKTGQQLPTAGEPSRPWSSAGQPAGWAFGERFPEEVTFKLPLPPKG